MVRRAIVGFGVDADGDRLARLDCGHGQHVRHRPPFVERPWTLTEAGRSAMLGTPLECLKCDRLEWPDGLVFARATPEFDARSLPAALRREHRTRAGVWGRLCVLAGSLRYVVSGAAPRTVEVPAGATASIAPQVAHHVEPLDESLRVRIEFWHVVSTDPVTRG